MFEKFKKSIIVSDQSINASLFRIMASAGAVLLLIRAIYMILGEMGLHSVMGLLLGGAALAVLAVVAQKTKKYKQCTVIMLLLLNLGVLPYTFINAGGLFSGMPLWFALGIIVLFFLLKGKWLYITVVLAAISDTFWVLYSYYYPAQVVSINTRMGIYQDICYSFILVVGITCFFMKIHMQLFENERKRFEEQQKQLEEAMQTQSRFLANMSHEIRTPINTIIGLNEMTLREEISDEVAENAIHIQSASKMLLALINDILDLSKIESGAMELVETRYELSPVFSDIVNMNWVRAHQKGLEFQVSVSEQLPSMLYGDDTRIKQIINNLVSNAIKYTPKGLVSLSVTGELRGPNRVMVRVSVEDSGIGIKQEDVEHLFENFKRVDEKHTKGIEGTGLGLSITRQLVEMMGGTIAVDSIYHKGSTFTVTFEQGVIDASPVGKLDYSAASSKNRTEHVKSFEAPEARVLVVDDNEMNLLVAKKLLRDSGVKLDLAMSGEECLELTAQKEYDIIFMDHMMPHMDGVETLGRLKNQSGGFNRETVVVALTANAMSGAQDIYKKHGFSDYLAKPISGVLLESMLLRYLPENKVEYIMEKETEEDMAGLSFRQHKRKEKILITTDSVCDLPQAVLDQFNISCMSYYVNTDVGHFEEGKEIHTNSVLEHIAAGRKAASEPPSVAEYEEFFSEMLQRAEQVIHIAMGSGSGMGFDRASEAARGFSHVVVFDSGHLSSGMGLVVMQAAKDAVMDMETERIIIDLERARKEVSTSFILTSPDQLYRSGRLRKQVWRISRLLSAHPVLAMRKRKISMAGIYFADTEKAMASYVRHELKGNKNIDTDVLFFTYAGMTKKERDRILELVYKYQAFEKIYEVPASAAITCNCGAGTFGLLYRKHL